MWGNLCTYCCVIVSIGIAVASGKSNSAAKSPKLKFTRITTRTGVSMCHQLDIWKISKEIQPPLKEAPAVARSFKIDGCPVLKRILCALEKDVSAFNCLPWSCARVTVKKPNSSSNGRSLSGSASSNGKPIATNRSLPLKGQRSEIQGRTSPFGGSAVSFHNEPFIGQIPTTKPPPPHYPGPGSHGQPAFNQNRSPGRSLGQGQGLNHLQIPITGHSSPPLVNQNQARTIHNPPSAPVFNSDHSDACNPQLNPHVTRTRQESLPASLAAATVSPEVYFGNLKEDDRVANDDLPEFYQKKQQLLGYTRSPSESQSTAYNFPFLVRISYLSQKCYWDKRDALESRVFSPHSYNWQEYKRCTGIILNGNYVLTSSFCGAWIERHLNEEKSELEFLKRDGNGRNVKSKPAGVDFETIFVYAGDFDSKLKNTMRQRREINSVTVDWMWQVDDRFKRQSFALVELKGSLDFAEETAFRPLWLPKRDRIINFIDNLSKEEGERKDDRAYFLSWGNENADKLNWNNHLKQLKMRIIPSSQPTCQEAMKESHFYLNDKSEYICAKFNFEGHSDMETVTTVQSLCDGGTTVGTPKGGHNKYPETLGFGTNIGGPLICESQNGQERLCGLLASNPSKSFTNEQDCQSKIISTIFVFEDLSRDTWQSKFQGLMTAGGSRGQSHFFQGDKDPVLLKLQSERSFDKIWSDISMNK